MLNFEQRIVGIQRAAVERHGSQIYFLRHSARVELIQLGFECRPTVLVLTKRLAFAQRFSAYFGGGFTGQKAIEGLARFVAYVVGTAGQVFAIGVGQHKLQPVGSAAKAVGIGEEPRRSFTVEIDAKLSFLAFFLILKSELFRKFERFLGKNW